MLDRLFEEMQEMRRAFDRAFETAATAPQATGSGTNEWVFVPPVETGWTDDYLNLRFVLPAVREEDIDVSVQGNQLLIRGERKRPEGFSKEGAGWYRLPYGKFERTVDLPGGLNFEKLEAHFQYGVLDIRVPVAEQMKPRKIEIASGESDHAKQIAA